MIKKVEVIPFYGIFKRFFKEKVATRVAIRVATRVAIAIRYPEKFRK